MIAPKAPAASRKILDPVSESVDVGLVVDVPRTEVTYTGSMMTEFAMPSSSPLPPSTTEYAIDVDTLDVVIVASAVISFRVVPTSLYTRNLLLSLMLPRSMVIVASPPTLVQDSENDAPRRRPCPAGTTS